VDFINQEKLSQLWSILMCIQMPESRRTDLTVGLGSQKFMIEVSANKHMLLD